MSLLFDYVSPAPAPVHCRSQLLQSRSRILPRPLPSPKSRPRSKTPRRLLLRSRHLPRLSKKLRRPRSPPLPPRKRQRRRLKKRQSPLSSQPLLKKLRLPNRKLLLLRMKPSLSPKPQLPLRKARLSRPHPPRRTPKQLSQKLRLLPRRSPPLPRKRLRLRRQNPPRRMPRLAS